MQRLREQLLSFKRVRQYARTRLCGASNGRNASRLYSEGSRSSSKDTFVSVDCTRKLEQDVKRYLDLREPIKVRLCEANL